MHELFTLSVGIDCGSQIHQVCVLTASQAVVGERRVAHTGAEIQALADWLLTLGETDPSRILVAIEVPRGPIVEALLERGFRVWAINPKQLDRFRERGTAAGAKDDQRDAWVLASAVQTDRYAFRALAVDDPQINQREWEQPVNWSGWFGSYSSRLDTRLWVPKRPMTGTGQALNFGHPGARTFILGMCIVPAALLLVLALM